MVAAYFSVPRITVFSSQLVTANNESSISLSFNLVNDSIQTVVWPGENVQAALGFATARGLFDSALEAVSLPAGPGFENLSAVSILQQASQQGISLATLSANNISFLATLNLPPDAVARITTAIENGLTVIVPNRTVTIKRGSNNRMA